MTKAKKLPPGVRLMPGGRYQARYPVTSDGVTRQVSAGTFATKADAVDARNTQLALLRTTGWTDPAKRRVKVEEWAKEWYALRRGPNRKVRSFLDARIIPHFGPWPIGSVTTLEVQRWVNELTAEGLSPATVRGLHQTLRQMLGKAVDYDMLTKNPVKDIDLPRMGDRGTIRLTTAQVLVIEAQSPPRFRAMVHLAAWAGLRWGECAALCWTDVDLEAGLVHVRRAMKHDRSFGLPKNGKTRTVALDAVAVEALREHRRDFGNTELLFTTTRQARPLTDANFRKHVWPKMIAGLEVEPTYHSLRHFHAAQMVREGMDWLVLADRLGHHSPAFTMTTYGYARIDKHDVAVAALERARTS